MARKQGSVSTTTATGAQLADSLSGEFDASLEQHQGECPALAVKDRQRDRQTHRHTTHNTSLGNNSLNAEWDSMVLSNDLSSSPEKDELDEVNCSSSHPPPSSQQQARNRACSADSRHSQMRSVLDIPREQPPETKTKCISSLVGGGGGAGAGAGGGKSNNRLKSGAMRVDTNSPLSGQKPAKRQNLVAEVMADLRAERDRC